ncbi:MAG: hypothetical protein OHK0017_04330 [Patescibacteria group bacterium]
MFKRKTHKATRKRISLTAGGKARYRKNNQNHFNIRRTSKRRLRHKRDNILEVDKKLNSLLVS